MLIVPAAPEVVIERLRNGLVSLLDEELNVVDSDDSIEFGRPHRLYTTALEDFVVGDLLGMDRMTSWQFIVLRDRQPFGLAEVYVERGPDGEDTFVYGGFGLESYAQSAVDAIGVAEGLPQVVERDYELRVLRAPTVYLYCIWLYSDQGDHLLLPCAPAPSPLTPNVVTPVDTIVTVLHDFAVHRLSVGSSDI